MGIKRGINKYRRRKKEEFMTCHRCSMCATSTVGETDGSYCCRKCEEIVHLRIVITRLKEQIDNLQQVAECVKFGDNSWLRLWGEVAEDIGSGHGAVGAGSGDCAAGAGSGDSAGGSGQW